MNKKQRILVLEDEAFTRNQIKEFLENQEYEVIAPKQPDCFEQWENEQQPDLILLDIGLGSQDGIQLCKRLRKIPRFLLCLSQGKIQPKWKCRDFRQEEMIISENPLISVCC